MEGGAGGGHVQDVTIVPHCVVSRMTRLNYYAIAITWKTYGEMEHGTHNSYPPTQLLKPSFISGLLYLNVELTECEIV